MGKKKNKNNYNNYYGEGMYNQEKNLQIAEHLEAYLDASENLFIFEGKKEADVKDAVKVIRKAIKNLKEGKPEKVFNEERFEEFYNSGKY